MQGLLADVNVQGHLRQLRYLLNAVELGRILDALDIRLIAFPEIQLDPNLDDRRLWDFCQREGWVLFTDNRTKHGPSSLQATLEEKWQDGLLPIITLSDKQRFERNHLGYSERVASDIAELLFGIKLGQYRDLPRFYVPLRSS